MRPEDITGLLHRDPFVPFRIYLASGKTYDITHPDLVMVLRSRIAIGVGADPATGVLDHLDHCSLLLIERLEELRETPASG